MKRFLSLLVCLCLLPACTLADRAYLIPDSNTRYLTETELWEWDYESLGYILNEIFARNGYNFIPGEKYDYYFRCMPWYTAQSCELIKECAKQHQVILLTCREDYLEKLNGNKISL